MLLQSKAPNGKAGSLSRICTCRLHQHSLHPLYCCCLDSRLPYRLLGLFLFLPKTCCQRKGVQSFFLSTGGSVSLCCINGNCRCTSAQTLISSNSREKATCTWGGRTYIRLCNLSFQGEMCSGKRRNDRGN